jgi:phosphoribosylanthranilate isomerase
LVRIKICGIMDAAAAVVAAAAGTDAIGLVFAPSRRQVTVDRAREIASALPPFITKVGVFVDDDPARIREMAEAVRLDMLQLHGAESPEYCAAIRLPVIKAVRMRDGRSAEAMRAYRVAAFLLDSFDPDVAGGTGKAFNWELAAGLRAPAPLILSGGLTPQNVRQALETVKPFGVDVSSGVETDGRKDHHKIREFIARVREWNGTS